MKGSKFEPRKLMFETFLRHRLSLEGSKTNVSNTLWPLDKCSKREFLYPMRLQIVCNVNLSHKRYVLFYRPLIFFEKKWVFLALHVNFVSHGLFCHWNKYWKKETYVFHSFSRLFLKPCCNPKFGSMVFELNMFRKIKVSLRSKKILNQH